MNIQPMPNHGTKPSSHSHSSCFQKLDRAQDFPASTSSHVNKTDLPRSAASQPATTSSSSQCALFGGLVDVHVPVAGSGVGADPTVACTLLSAAAGDLQSSMERTVEEGELMSVALQGLWNTGMILETGVMEQKVAGAASTACTGSHLICSHSAHGLFSCV
jgi:hypothetical protein